MEDQFEYTKINLYKHDIYSCIWIISGVGGAEWTAPVASVAIGLAQSAQGQSRSKQIPEKTKVSL